ncbi:MAG: TRAP-type C4-dicarboxylate transport system permease small subunit [Arenicella sp.]|jgi:TRAP-type C4-dicarboxylate transport system permease small subunit
MFAIIEKALRELSAAAIILMAVLVSLEVVLRSLFGTTLPDTMLIVRELMVVCIVLPLAYASFLRSHVVVDFLANKLPARIRARLVVFGSIVGLCVFSILLYAGVNELLYSIVSKGFYYGDLGLSKWPSRLVFLIGVGFCWLRLFIQIKQDLRSLRLGDFNFYQREP